MKLNTKYHGICEYEEKDTITFNKGLPGFENLRKFIILPVEDNDIFSILHSTEDNGVGFVVVSPFNVVKEYQFELDGEVINRLKINNQRDVLIVNTVTLSSEIQKITANLRAPIIINTKENLGEQIILNNEDYLIKYPLFKEDI